MTDHACADYVVTSDEGTSYCPECERQARDLDVWLDVVAQSAYGWPDSLRFTYEKTRELLAGGVPGDLVECGVAAGSHPAAMAKACMDAGETRTIRLFDSFQGIPMGSDRDGDWNKAWGDGSGRLESSGVTVHTAESVQENLARWLPGCDLPIVLHPGWFQSTCPAFARAAIRADAEIAYLRIDCDLYASTLACLTCLYPLVSRGGIIVCDDMNLDGCREAVREYMTSIAAGDQVWTSITESGDAWTVKA